MSGLTPYGNTSKKVQEYFEQCIITWVESLLNKLNLFFQNTITDLSKMFQKYFL